MAGSCVDLTIGSDHAARIADITTRQFATHAPVAVRTNARTHFTENAGMGAAKSKIADIDKSILVVPDEPTGATLTREQIAHHEAAHAVLAHLLGGGIDATGIDLGRELIKGEAPAPSYVGTGWRSHRWLMRSAEPPIADGMLHRGSRQVRARTGHGPNRPKHLLKRIEGLLQVTGGSRNAR